MHTIQPHGGARPIHIWTDFVEESAMAQLENLAQMPFLHPHGLAVMPDVHYGIGSTVGSVIATRGAIIPAAVGVDIGCGMNAVRTSLYASALPDNLAELRHDIERSIPLGPGAKHRAVVGEINGSRWNKLVCDFQVCVPGGLHTDNVWTQLGTLGSGNHFIEVCLDEEQRVWVVLHSGSRGIGNQIGRHYITKAKEMMARYFITLPDVDLAYFPDKTDEYHDYVRAVQWAQDYAMENRQQMMRLVLRSMRYRIPHIVAEDEVINCHHNYVEMEHHYGQDVLVTRKGAIRAREGDLGIIPGSMGAATYIVRGRGNPASYSSCSHGAGRAMSRTEGKRRFTVDDLERQTLGIECRKDAGVLDEAPGNYKPIDQVMANQADLVEVVHTLRQVLNVKGN